MADGPVLAQAKQRADKGDRAPAALPKPSGVAPAESPVLTDALNKIDTEKSQPQRLAAGDELRKRPELFLQYAGRLGGQSLSPEARRILGDVADTIASGKLSNGDAILKEVAGYGSDGTTRILSDFHRAWREVQRRNEVLPLAREIENVPELLRRLQTVRNEFQAVGAVPNLAENEIRPGSVRQNMPALFGPGGQFSAKPRLNLPAAILSEIARFDKSNEPGAAEAGDILKKVFLERWTKIYPNEDAKLAGVAREMTGLSYLLSNQKGARDIEALHKGLADELREAQKAPEARGQKEQTETYLRLGSSLRDLSVIENEVNANKPVAREEDRRGRLIEPMKDSIAKRDPERAEKFLSAMQMLSSRQLILPPIDKKIPVAQETALGAVQRTIMSFEQAGDAAFAAELRKLLQ